MCSRCGKSIGASVHDTEFATMVAAAVSTSKKTLRSATLVLGRCPKLYLQTEHWRRTAITTSCQKAALTILNYCFSAWVNYGSTLPGGARWTCNPGLANSRAFVGESVDHPQTACLC